MKILLKLTRQAIKSLFHCLTFSCDLRESVCEIYEGNIRGIVHSII